MNFNAMLGSQMRVCFSQRSGSDRQGNWELRTLRQGGFRQGIGSLTALTVVQFVSVSLLNKFFFFRANL